MKRFYIAVLAFVGVTGLQAQTFSLSANVMNIDLVANSSAYQQTTITNTTSATVDFRYELINQTLNSGWDMQFCDPNSCFVSPRQTDDFQLQREASSIFKLEIVGNGFSGSGTYQLKVYPINNPTEVDTITWNINSAVGIEEPSFGKFVTVYPNPAQDLLTIGSSEGPLVKGNVQVFDLNGRLLVSQDVKATFESSIDVSALAPGMYSLRYMTAQGAINRKFMKQN